MTAAKGTPTWDDARPGLVKALKEMVARIRSLESRVAALELLVTDEDDAEPPEAG